MPSGPRELHEEFKSDVRACDYLESRGFKMLKGWVYTHPELIELSEKDSRALDYLMWEWDYGGYIPFDQLKTKKPAPIKARADGHRNP